MKTMLIIFFSVILSINAFSQPMRNIINNENFYVNIIAIPTNHNDSIDVFICYTFSYNSLVFQRTNDNRFFSTPILETTFRDNDGIIRRRFISNDTIFVNNFEQTQENFFYSNTERFRLANSDYRIISKFNNSKNRSNPIEYAIFKYSNDNNLTNMFVLDYANKPFFSNNCISFDVLYFSIFIPIKSANTEYNYTIKKIESSRNQLAWKNFNEIEGKFNVIKGVQVETKDNSFELISTTDTNFYSFLTAKINMYRYNFTPGKYILTITNGDKKAQFEFEIKWYNMPNSLLDPAFAIEQMFLILSDEEYKKMKRGDRNEIFANILNYWKQHDPTPATEYNEAMAEFFNRVDYAEINFRTLTQKEGAKSDRGKIYILNGSPDEISTNIQDKKTNEIWFYKALNKSYIFEVVSVGNYKLVRIEE